MAKILRASRAEGIDRMPSKKPGLLGVRFQRLICRDFYSIGRLVEEGRSADLS
jgi:anaerobic glycerol-3-phosphate dehydrogenase